MSPPLPPAFVAPARAPEAPRRRPGRLLGRWFPATALVLGGAAASCATGDAAGSWVLRDELGTDWVRPHLEEIFLRPPVSGDPPSLAGLAADGTWALVRWSPPDATAASAPRRRELRLVETGTQRTEPGVGTPLTEFLPAQPEGPPGPEEDSGDPGDAPEERVVDDPALRTAWSRSGHRLAVARGNELFLLEPGRSGAARRILAWEAPGPRGDGPDGPDGSGGPGGDEKNGTLDDAQDAPPADRAGAEPRLDPAAEPADPPVPRLGTVRELFFSPDDTRLGVSDGKEYFELVLPAPGGTGADASPPAGLDDTLWWSRSVESDSDALWWSRDHAVVLGHDPVPRPGADPDAQVWHVLEERAVVLEGMAEIEVLEDVALSPDGRFVFALEVDRSTDPGPTLVPDYLTERVSVREARRRLADDRPTPVRMWMWDAHDGTRVELSFADPGGAAEEAPRPWLRVVGWTYQGGPQAPARMLVERRSEDMRELELWCWSEGSFAPVHRERDEGWIGGPARRTVWTHDGTRILFGSERAAGSTSPGRSQLFVLDVGDPQAGALQLTDVAGEMTSFRPLPDGGVLFQFSGDDPGQRGWGLVHPAAVRGAWSAPPAIYATPPGWNRDARASRDGARLVYLHEELLVPAELQAADLEDHVVLSHTRPAAFDAIPWIRPERVVIPSPDGVDVHAHVYLPPGVTLEAPGEARASIVFVHGAGYLQNVTDSMTRYPLNMMFHARLAHLGYPVVDVDYRGSAGYGARFRSDVQYHLGGKDLDDIHLVVDVLADAGVVDPERVGIYGGSYGGFMAMMALFTAPERWAVGCALRSVTDWRTYHPAYTVPRLGRPSTHPEAYAASSPIDHVDGLEDPLLVLHGMMDANVFAQDSIRLIEALIERGKEFDAMLYPSQGHAFAKGEHWLDEYRRIERYLTRHLGPPLPDDEAIWVAAGTTSSGWIQGGWIGRGGFGPWGPSGPGGPWSPPEGPAPARAPTTFTRGVASFFQGVFQVGGAAFQGLGSALLGGSGSGSSDAGSGPSRGDGLGSSTRIAPSVSRPSPPARTTSVRGGRRG